MIEEREWREKNGRGKAEGFPASYSFLLDSIYFFPSEVYFLEFLLGRICQG